MGTPDRSWTGTDRPGAVPPGVRAVSGFTAAAGAALLLLAALGYQGPARPFTAAAVAVTVAPVLLLFAAVAVRPGEARSRIRERTGADIADPAQTLAFALAVVAVLVVFGFTFVSVVNQLEALVLEGKGLPPPTEGQVLRSVGLNVVVFLIPPAAWSLWVDEDTREEAADRLGLRVGAPVQGLAWGVGLVLGSFVVLAALAGLFQLLGFDPPANERAIQLGKALSIPSALAVSAAAAVGEEIFFRGWLQAKLGNVPQALLFSFAHFTYLNVLEAVVTLALGYAFGLARERTDSLLGPGLAHFGFNAVTFLAIMYA